jgi:hypothetical protein
VRLLGIICALAGEVVVTQILLFQLLCFLARCASSIDSDDDKQPPTQSEMHDRYCFG